MPFENVELMNAAKLMTERKRPLLFLCTIKSARKAPHATTEEGVAADTRHRTRTPKTNPKHWLPHWLMAKEAASGC